MSTNKEPQKPQEKQTFKILYVDGGISRLSQFRGEVLLRTFANFYDRHANVTFLTISPEMLRKLNVDILKKMEVNVLWLDNTIDAVAVQNLNNILGEMMDEASPGWKAKLSDLMKDNKEEAEKFVLEIKESRANNLRVFYSLDEFVWEGQVGRSQTIQTVNVVESYLNISDVIVVPTLELGDAIKHFGFINNQVEVAVMPTSISHEFFPLFKNMNKELVMNANAARKAKILIKGFTIQENVQSFIETSYKDFDLYICSLGEISDSIIKLIKDGKIKNLYHWANPNSSKKNFTTTYAMERDIGFDMMLYCFPEDMSANLYELTMGDEDVLFSVASGVLPICGSEHIGYDSNHIYNSSGLTFSTKTPYEDIKKMVRSHYYDSTKFNSAFSKSRVAVENRVITSPQIMSTLYGLLLGKKKAQELSAKIKEQKDTISTEVKNEPKEITEVK